MPANAEVYELSLQSKHSALLLKNTRKRMLCVSSIKQICAWAKKIERVFSTSFYAFSPICCFRGTPPNPIFLGSSSCWGQGKNSVPAEKQNLFL